MSSLIITDGAIISGFSLYDGCILMSGLIMAGSCIIWESWLYIGLLGVKNNQTKCQFTGAIFSKLLFSH